MPSEWIETTLGEVVTLKRGYDLPEQDRVPGPHPIVSSSGVTGRHAEAKVKGPGVITGRYGTLGEIHYITDDYWPLNTTLYVQDFHGNDPRFISYFLRSLNFQAFSDKSSVPGLNRNHLHAEPVRFPKDVDEQRAIAHVLGALDDRIELNRRMDRTLEALARAVFRAWFVDFEPVKAKAAGAASFPGMPQPVFDQLPTNLVDSDLGPIPEGWSARPLGDVLNVTMGQSPPSRYYNEQGDGLPFHQGVTDYGFRFPTHRVYCTEEARLADKHDVLLSVRAPVGRINVADRRLVVGRGLAALRHPAGFSSYALYLLKHLFAEEDAVGDGTIYKAITKQFLLSMPIIDPVEYASRAFEEQVRPLDDLLETAERESRTLAAIRDALLPKLISGDVRLRAQPAKEESERRNLAYHEAGHYVLGYRRGMEAGDIRIEGGPAHEKGSASVRWDKSTWYSIETGSATEDVWTTEYLVASAGYLSQTKDSQAELDVRDLAADRGRMDAAFHSLLELTGTDRGELERRLHELARQEVLAAWPEIEALAEALLQRGALSRDEALRTIQGASRQGEP